MKWKITAQTIAERMAKEKGISKRSADTFMRAFIETLEEGLRADGTVKIEGFGTFKTVNMGSRESVNVTNGARMTISGYTKVAFTPADSITALLTQRLAAANDASAAERDVSAVPVRPAAETSATPTPSPDAASNFDAIDDIIATPESEMPAPVSPSPATPAKSVPETPPATETPQTAELSTPQPDKVAPQSAQTEPQTAQATSQPETLSQPAPSSPHTSEEQAKPEGASGNPRETDEDGRKKTRKRRPLWIVAALCVVALLLFAALYLGTNKRTTQAETTRPTTETPQAAPQHSPSAATKAQTATPDSAAKGANATSAAASQPAKSARPKTYTLQKGQSLTDVSVMFYHTKDSVRALIRANNFRDPNNVYIGTVIQLP